MLLSYLVFPGVYVDEDWLDSALPSASVRRVLFLAKQRSLVQEVHFDTARCGEIGEAVPCHFAVFCCASVTVKTMNMLKMDGEADEDETGHEDCNFG